MASAVKRAYQAPVGSAKWIYDERQQAEIYVDEEVNEFTFSARNEMEWLNEHMAEIFSKDQVTVTEIFKTPGKLRGKTPRTGTKHRNPLEDRLPLTDVFMPTPNARPSPAQNTQFYKNIAQFQIAEDKENAPAQPLAKAAQPTRTYSEATTQGNNDSGYHDMTDDEFDSDGNTNFHTVPVQFSPKKLSSPPKIPSSPKRAVVVSPVHRSPSRVRSEDSFVSAKEAPNSTRVSHDSPVKMNLPGSFDATVASGELPSISQQQNPTNAIELPEQASNPADFMDIDEVEEADAGVQSPDSDGISSPERPLLRKKSSLNFASLPAREPLNKMSVGARVSRTSHFDSIKHTNAFDRQTTNFEYTKASQGTRTESQQISRNQQLDIHEDDETDELAAPAADTNKTSTQRLHERITMLGQQGQSRPSKSISSKRTSRLALQEVPHNAADQQKPASDMDVEMAVDEWIEPLPATHKTVILEETTTHRRSTRKSSLKRARPDQHLDLRDSRKKSAVGVFDVQVGKDVPVARASPEVQAKAAISHSPGRKRAAETQTPLASPAASRLLDGPISASKSRLYSVIKSAKNLFASSAGASAQAKAEALSLPKSTSQPPKTHHDAAETAASIYPELPKQVSQPASDVANGDANPGRRVSARLEAQKAQVEPVLDISSKQDDENSRPLAGKGKALDRTYEDRPPLSRQATEQSEVLPHASAKIAQTASQLFKQGELRRPVKPNKDVISRTDTTKPQAVSVKVGSQRIAGKGQPAAHTTPGPDPTTAPSSSARPTLAKKTSSQSIKTSSSTQSFKGVKALEAAARKREQDEREAKRKAEQKREVERKRAAKAEEERRQAQEQRAAEQKALEARAIAAKQALDQRKAEAARRLEQAKSQQAAAERVAEPPRPMSRMGDSQQGIRHAVPHINPAKPPKRHWDADEEDREERSRPPVTKKVPAYAQEQDGKRRKTDDFVEEPATRPSMAPPVRPGKFTQGFMAQNTAPGHQTMLQKAINGAQHQHPKTPSSMAQYSNARIPFADAPQTAQSSRPQPNAFKKTPATVHKSSPHYPNGDNVSLPEINTDDEDSDADDNGFEPPDWANSPALRELLARQQLVDPMEVFGPIQPIAIEDIFKGNKERQARFRNRTSSANWNGPDRLTEEERRRDFEAREKLEKAGGWQFKDAVL